MSYHTYQLTTRQKTQRLSLLQYGDITAVIVLQNRTMQRIMARMEPSSNQSGLIPILIAIFMMFLAVVVLVFMRVQAVQQ